MEFLTTENALTIFKIVTSVVGSFALIATLTKNTTDDRIAQVILDVVNFLGGNIGNAANAPDVDADGNPHGPRGR